MPTIVECKVEEDVKLSITGFSICDIFRLLELLPAISKDHFNTDYEIYFFGKRKLPKEA